MKFLYKLGTLGLALLLVACAGKPPVSTAPDHTRPDSKPAAEPVVAPPPATAPVVTEAEAAAARQRFVSALQGKGFKRGDVQAVLEKAQKRDDIIALMIKPAEGKPWRDYAPIFLTEQRLKYGLQFWRDNEALLARAEAEYGVPARIIVSIIGVETQYGRIMGKFRVLDALNTLAFYYPPRSPFFTGELEQFFLLAQEQGWDHEQPLGSYAGAMGMGQFMPTSYRKWAVDFDGDGKINLFSNPADVIGSVANYFKLHGWQTGGAVMMRVADVPTQTDGLLFPKRDLKPFRDLLDAGVKGEFALHDEVPVVLLGFDESEARRHYLGFANFRVITRYNRSPLYARAVYEFAERLQAARSAG